MAILNKSFYILRIISFKSAGSIVLHCGLELSKQLLVIHDIAKILTIIIKTVDTANRLKQAVILHSLVNVKVGTRRRIKSSEQLVHDDKELHICRLLYKLALCFLFKFLHLGLNRSRIRKVRRIKPQHLQIRLVFEEGFSIILIADGISAQFALVRCIGRYDGALLKAHLLEYFVILTSRRNTISYKNRITVSIHQTWLHIKILNDVPCNLFQTRPRTVYLLHRAPLLFELCLSTRGKASGLYIKPLVNTILRRQILGNITILIAQIQYDTIGHAFVIFIRVDVCTENFDTNLFISFQQRSTGKSNKHCVWHNDLHRRMKFTGLRSVTFINKYHKISLCLEIGRERGFQLFDILIVVIFCCFATTAAKLMYQRADQRIIIYIQTIQQILTALGTSNILIHAGECFFYLLIKFISVCNDKYTSIKLCPMCQNPLCKPCHCQRFAGTLRVPQNTAHWFIRISVRIVKLRPQIINPLLSTLDAKILIVAAHFFDAFIKDHKIHDKVDKSFLIEHGIYLLQEFILDAFAGFTDTNIYRITFFLMFFETVILPFHIELLSGQKRAITQSF